MSYKACRVADARGVHRFDWARLDGDDLGPAPPPGLPLLPSEILPPPADPQAHLAALERDAFAKGYAAGERAGLEAGGKRADAMLRRVAQTIDELTGLRATIVRETERQMVELALALARRVVDRELTLAPDLVAAMAHVALDRLGEQTPATIRLNPADYGMVVAERGEQWEGTHVSVVPDPAVARGGCLVESDFGVVDASADAQLGELARALLGGPGQDGFAEASGAR
jgi:flagellar assembly protein FliH